VEKEDNFWLKLQLSAETVLVKKKLTLRPQRQRTPREKTLPCGAAIC